MAALIVVLPVVVLAGAWRLGGASALEDDLIYYLPVREYIGRCLAAGELPLWNPLVAMGVPVAADPQAGLWYPPTWLFAVAPARWAYPATLVLHFALAGAGMYRFLRASRRRPAAALLGAVAFELSGFLVAHRAHLTILEAAAWLPWMLYAWRRQADRGGYRYFALAVAALGLQMLVQHVQVTAIGLAVLTGYVGVVLWPRRRALAWEYPAGAGLGVMVGGVQLIPTLFYFAGSARGAPAFHLFVENSWWPGSAALMLFPALFGARTPNALDGPWWGLSHFCEQSGYASVLVLGLALASLGLLRRRGPDGTARWDREVVFWWAAVLAALVLALGKYGPAAETLFRIPFYRSFRVPARWILVWSLALPVLASAAVSAAAAGGEPGARAAAAVRRATRWAVPGLAALGLVVLGVMRWRVDALAERFSSGDLPAFWEGLRAAIRPGNPALWGPLVLIVVTAAAAGWWSRRPGQARFACLLAVLVADLGSVAARIDVDTRTYTPADVSDPPPLARAIEALHPQPGDRLLVPREQASYDRPIEVLWPQTNVRWGIATFHGYGPLWPIGHRVLLGFMPWGSSEAMPRLLGDPGLCRAMGVRFVAVRSGPERAVFEAARWPRLPGSRLELIEATAEGLQAVRAGRDLLWPVRIDSPGLYELAMEAAPGPDAGSRCFVRAETAAGTGLGPTWSVEPADLSLGKRTLRFLLRCDRPPGGVRIRVKSERGDAMSAGRARFGCVAREPASGDDGSPSLPASGPAGEQGSLWVHRGDLPGGVSLYELPETRELVHWLTRAVPVADLREGVERVGRGSADGGLPDGGVVEWSDRSAAPPTGGAGPIALSRVFGHEVRAKVNPPAAGLLVFNESYDPGWRAYVDGHPAGLYRVNGVAQGVVVPAGRHEVRFAYGPAGLRAGGMWTGVSILVLLAGGLATLGVGGRKRTEGAPDRKGVVGTSS